MEKWESWGDYKQYRCPECGFKADNRKELEEARKIQQGRRVSGIFKWRR
jgi:DNA-directed RNA polymerase subunit RPC12/RpoP